MWTQLTWEEVQTLFDEYSEKANPMLEETRHWIQQYPLQQNSPDGLHQLLGQLNVLVLDLGDLQANASRLKLWTDKQYDIEKSRTFVQLVKDGKSATYAGSAKYIGAEAFLQQLADCNGLHLRLQNARSSARDTTEGIRSRISTIKTSIRSS